MKRQFRIECSIAIEEDGGIVAYTHTGEVQTFPYRGTVELAHDQARGSLADMRPIESALATALRLCLRPQ